MAAACLATAISPTLGSPRSAMMCLTTRSRAPLQDTECGGDRQPDETRSVSQAGRKLRLWRQFYPKPYRQQRSGASLLTHGGVIRLAPARVLAQAPPWKTASGCPPLLGVASSRAVPLPSGVGDGVCRPLADFPLTGRLVSAADLLCLLPNADNLLHRK